MNKKSLDKKNKTLSTKRQRNLSQFTTVLISDVVEWLLIFLLFINGVFSYLVTKLARFCELQTPCMLCSRVDHLLDSEAPGFYFDLICSAHKLEISSLVFCHLHKKLADVHGMCEGCLCSSATEKKSNSETSRLLVGKLGADFERSDDQSALVEDPPRKLCSCCHEPWISRLDNHKILQFKSTGSEVTELNRPLQNVVEKDQSPDRDVLNSRELISREFEPSSIGTNSFHPSSHIGYSELKITSDSESEVSASDDGRSSIVLQANHLKKNIRPHSVRVHRHTVHPEYVSKFVSNDLSPEEPIHQVSVSVPSPLLPEAHQIACESHDLKSSASAPISAKGLHDLNWNPLEENMNDSLPPEPISLQEIPSSSNIGRILAEDSEEISYATGINVLEPVSIERICNLETGPVRSFGSDMKNNHIINEHDPQMHSIMDPCNASIMPEISLNWQLDDSEISVSEPSLLFPNANYDAIESHDLTSSAPAAVSAQGLEDIVWNQVEERADASPPPEVVSSKDAPSSPNIGNFAEAPPAVSAQGLEDIDWNQVEERADASPPPEVVSSKGAPSASNIGNVTEEMVEASNVTRLDVLEPGSIKTNSELENGLIMLTGSDIRKNQVVSDRGAPVTNLMDLSDAYKLAISNKVNQTSNMPEQFVGKDSARVSGDIKLSLSQISSSSRGFELSLSEMSPRVYAQWEDFRISDAPSPIGLQILQKRISLERNMSGFESLDGSIVSEIDGENLVDRLKRQVEYDRKSINTLYKELEEERNASAVAANQALAMITRLQEEKATLQMEALQYLRMMEEQAEYDVDAIQNANVLLAEKEKELHDLEAELEIYREKLPSESTVEKTQEATPDAEGGNTRMKHSDLSIRYSFNTPCNTPREPFEERKKPDKIIVVNGNNSTHIARDSLVGFEDDRSYISQCLNKLEKKLLLFSNNGVDFRNGKYPGKEEHGADYLKQSEDSTRENSHMEKGRSSMQKDLYVCFPSQGNCSSPSVDHQFVTNEKYSSDYEGKDQETHLVALEHEVSYLNERLKALEADRNFLEHTINSLRTGDGIHFIQEIADDLRELRRIGIRREQAL